MVRNAAISASDVAQDTYERGARYVRDGFDSLPDVSRYGRAMSRPVAQNPVLAILAAGAVGYLVAFLAHGGGWQAIWWSPLPAITGQKCSPAPLKVSSGSEFRHLFDGTLGLSDT